MIRPRIRDAGDAALLAELPARVDPMTNAAVMRLAERVKAAAIKGVRDIVPAIRSLAVFYDPVHTDVDALKSVISGTPLEPDIASEGPLHEIPVVYGGDAGPDLEDVAAASGMSVAQLIAAHAGRNYRVYMLGFLPGFAYLGTLDSTIVASRRAVPRLKVPAGAVAVAGRQAAIYPRDSPGGWALIGRTDVVMFDPTSPRPSRFAPGDRVRFVPVDGTRERVAGSGDSPHVLTETRVSAPAIEVRRAGLMTTVQDAGRWGHQAEGVSISGAMDHVAHRLANAVVGNESSAATLEVTVVGPELTFLADTVIAITGADLSPSLGGAAVPPQQAVSARAGTTLSFGQRRRGARAYVAFAGGIATPFVLGSRATHLASNMGGYEGRALRVGDRISLLPRGPLPKHLPSISSGRTARVASGARVRVLPGPQSEAFPETALAQLTSTRFTLSPDSNRMGYRLADGSIAAPDAEMISDVTFPGAVQIPPSGAPILLMADRQTTGGYAQLAVVISADLPLAGQLAPGDWIEFELTTRAEALTALHEQARALQHLEGHAFA